MKPRLLSLALAVALALFASRMGGIVVIRAESPTPAFCYDDALIPPGKPEGEPSGSPPGYWETSEYLIGKVAVGIIFLESNGSIDAEA